MRTTVAATIVASAMAGNLHDRSFYEEKFFNWLSTHKISATDGSHFVHMLQNFADNDDLIASTNAKNLSYKLGHNQFSHLSRDEWRKYVRLGLEKPDDSTAADVHHPSASNPDAVDWRSKGAVTAVKDQGQCGSCWSFSTTGALEGAYFNKYNSLKSFSEQQFVDCDNLKHRGRDKGCNGGLMDNAFDWAAKNGGICYEADYPYTSGTTKKEGECQTTCTKDSKVAPKSHTDVTKNSDSAMESALAKQPVSVAIEADQSAFQLYASGIFDATCGTSLDHGVLAVGYGVENGAQYYIVKNSWGESWGDKGYIRFAKGGNMQKEGQCGILSGPPSYPNL